MSNAAVTVRGIDEVQRLLNELPQIVVAKAFLDGLQAARAVMVTALIANTPEREDSNTRPDDQSPLNESVVAQVTLDGQLRGGSVRVGFGRMGHVALWVEKGHAKVGHKPDKKELGGYTKANHFMARTIDEVYEEAVAAFGGGIEAALARGIL